MYPILLNNHEMHIADLMVILQTQLSVITFISRMTGSKARCPYIN